MAVLPIRFLKAAVRSLVVGVVDGAITVDASPDSCREDAVEMPAAPYRFASHPYLMNHRTFLNSYKIPTSSLLYQSHSDKKKICIITTNHIKRIEYNHSL